MNTCTNQNYFQNCPTQCVKINQCSELAKNDECDRSPEYMMKPLKEGGCKEVCDQRTTELKAIMDYNPFGKLLLNK